MSLGCVINYIYDYVIRSGRIWDEDGKHCFCSKPEQVPFAESNNICSKASGGKKRSVNFELRIDHRWVFPSSVMNLYTLICVDCNKSFSLDNQDWITIFKPQKSNVFIITLVLHSNRCMLMNTKHNLNWVRDGFFCSNVIFVILSLLHQLDKIKLQHSNKPFWTATLFEQCLGHCRGGWWHWTTFGKNQCHQCASETCSSNYTYIPNSHSKVSFKVSAPKELNKKKTCCTFIEKHT